MLIASASIDRIPNRSVATALPDTSASAAPSRTPKMARIAPYRRNSHEMRRLSDAIRLREWNWIKDDLLMTLKIAVAAAIPRPRASIAAAKKVGCALRGSALKTTQVREV